MGRPASKDLRVGPRRAGAVDAVGPAREDDAPSGCAPGFFGRGVVGENLGVNLQLRGGGAR